MFTIAKFCCPPNARETKRESREARGGYRIICLRGIRGWTVCKNRNTTRAIKHRGIPQDVDAVRERTSISRIPLNSNINSLYLSLNTFSLRPFLPVLKWIFLYDQISQISFFLYNAWSFEYFLFLFTNFIIYIEIWHTGMILPFGWTCYVWILTEPATLQTSQADVCKVCKPYLWTWCHQALVFFFFLKQWPKKYPFSFTVNNMWSATANSSKWCLQLWHQSSENHPQQPHNNPANVSCWGILP